MAEINLDKYTKTHGIKNGGRRGKDLKRGDTDLVKEVAALEAHQIDSQPVTEGYSTDQTGSVAQSLEIHDLNVPNRAMREELEQLEAERAKEAELQRLKKEILTKKTDDLIPGYTEVLIGEKRTAYEDEAENQIKLQQAQFEVKELVRINSESIRDLGDPRDIGSGFQRLTIDERIKKVEKGIKNQFYAQLAQIIQVETKRKNQNRTGRIRKSQSNNKSRNYLRTDGTEVVTVKDDDEKSMFGQFTEMANKSAALITQRAAQKRSNERFQAHLSKLVNQHRSPVASGKQSEMLARRASEISQHNLQLLQKPETLSQERAFVSKHQRALSLNMHQHSDLVALNDASQFVTPLNAKLDAMKRRIHDLMFCSGVEDRLVAETRPDDARPERFRDSQQITDSTMYEEPEHRALRAAIMRNLEDANATFAPVGFEEKQDMLKAAHSNLDPSHEPSSTEAGQVPRDRPIRENQDMHVVLTSQHSDVNSLSKLQAPIHVPHQNHESPEYSNEDGVRVLKSKEGDGDLALSKIMEHGHEQHGNSLMSSAKADVSHGGPAYDDQSRSNEPAGTLGASADDRDGLDLRKLRLNEASHEEMDERTSQASLLQQRPPLVNVDMHQPSEIISEHVRMPVALPTINPGHSSLSHYSPEPFNAAAAAAETNSIFESINYDEVYDDRVLEENFRLLEERLKMTLPVVRKHQYSKHALPTMRSEATTATNVQQGTTSSQRQPMQFKSSHISYVQYLISQRDKYATRLKEFDRSKSTMSYEFIRNKLNRQAKLARAQNNQDTTESKTGPFQLERREKRLAADRSHSQNMMISPSTGVGTLSPTALGGADLQYILMPALHPMMSPQAMAAQELDLYLGSQGPPPTFTSFPRSTTNQISVSRLSNKKILDEAAQLSSQQLSAGVSGQAIMDDIPRNFIMLSPQNYLNQHQQGVTQSSELISQAALLSPTMLSGQLPRPMGLDDRILSEIKLNQLSQHRFQDYLRRLQLEKASSSTIGDIRDTSKGSLHLNVAAHSKATLLKERKRREVEEAYRRREMERAQGATGNQAMNIQSETTPVAALDGRKASHQSTDAFARAIETKLLNQNSEHGGSDEKLRGKVFGLHQSQSPQTLQQQSQETLQNDKSPSQQDKVDSGRKHERDEAERLLGQVQESMLDAPNTLVDVQAIETRNPEQQKSPPFAQSPQQMPEKYAKDITRTSPTGGVTTMQRTPITNKALEQQPLEQTRHSSLISLPKPVDISGQNMTNAAGARQGKVFPAGRRRSQVNQAPRDNQDIKQHIEINEETQARISMKLEDIINDSRNGRSKKHTEQNVTHPDVVFLPSAQPSAVTLHNEEAKANVNIRVLNDKDAKAKQAGDQRKTVRPRVLGLSALKDHQRMLEKHQEEQHRSRVRNIQARMRQSRDKVDVVVRDPSLEKLQHRTLDDEPAGRFNLSPQTSGRGSRDTKALGHAHTLDPSHEGRPAPEGKKVVRLPDLNLKRSRDPSPLSHLKSTGTRNLDVAIPLLSSEARLHHSQSPSQYTKMRPQQLITQSNSVDSKTRLVRMLDKERTAKVRITDQKQKLYELRQSGDRPSNSMHSSFDKSATHGDHHGSQLVIAQLRAKQITIQAKDKKTISKSKENSGSQTDLLKSPTTCLQPRVFSPALAGADASHSVSPREAIQRKKNQEGEKRAQFVRAHQTAKAGNIKNKPTYKRVFGVTGTVAANQQSILYETLNIQDALRQSVEDDLNSPVQKENLDVTMPLHSSMLQEQYRRRNNATTSIVPNARGVASGQFRTLQATEYHPVRGGSDEIVRYPNQFKASPTTSVKNRMSIANNRHVVLVSTFDAVARSSRGGAEAKQANNRSNSGSPSQTAQAFPSVTTSRLNEKKSFQPNLTLFADAPLGPLKKNEGSPRPTPLSTRNVLQGVQIRDPSGLAQRLVAEKGAETALNRRSPGMDQATQNETADLLEDLTNERNRERAERRGEKGREVLSPQVTSHNVPFLQQLGSDGGSVDHKKERPAQHSNTFMIGKAANQNKTLQQAALQQTASFTKEGPGAHSSHDEPTDKLPNLQSVDPEDEVNHLEKDRRKYGAKQIYKEAKKEQALMERDNRASDVQRTRQPTVMSNISNINE